MITFIFIVVIIYFVYKEYTTPDKKGSQEDIDAAINKLPEIHLKGKPVSGLNAVFYGKGYSLDKFDFKDGYLSMSLQNGKVFRGLLKNYTFRFENTKGIINISLEIHGRSTTFNYVDGLFTKDEWNAICGVMLCAGKTYNASVIQNQFGTMSKLQAAAKVGQLIYKISQL